MRDKLGPYLNFMMLIIFESMKIIPFLKHVGDGMVANRVVWKYIGFVEGLSLVVDTAHCHLC